MSAIGTLFLAHVNQNDVIVHSGPLYAATETMIAKILSRFGVSYLDFPAEASATEIRVVMEAAKAMAAEKGGRVAMLYLESPANPTNALVDVEACRDVVDSLFAEGERPPIAIDNTFLGPLWSRPLHHGADVVVYSLTKYAGGHSDLVAGGVLGYWVAGPWEALFPYLLVAAASSFVYVAVADLLPQLQQRLPWRGTLAQLGWIAAGLLLIVGLKSLQHAGH